jgi:hypothetical protein
MRWTWNRGRLSVQPLRGKLLRGRANSFLWLLLSRSIDPKRDSTHRLQAERSDIARDHNKETKGGRHQDAYIPSRGPRGHVAPLIREVFASAVSSDSDNNKSVQYRSAEKLRGCQPGLFSKCEGMVKRAQRGQTRPRYPVSQPTKVPPFRGSTALAAPTPQGWGRHSVRWPRSERVES